MTAAVISRRRIRISPLGVARRAVSPKPTPRPLLLVATGMAGLALTVVSDRRTRRGEIAVAYAIGAAFLVMIVGIVLSGAGARAARPARRRCGPRRLSVVAG